MNVFYSKIVITGTVGIEYDSDLNFLIINVILWIFFFFLIFQGNRSDQMNSLIYTTRKYSSVFISELFILLLSVFII